MKKNHQKQYQITDTVKSKKQKDKLEKFPMPSFGYGLECLKIPAHGDARSELVEFSDNWFAQPEKYLAISPDLPVTVSQDGNFLTFPSVLDHSRVTRFKFNPQPEGSPGRKVALIHVMHWNGRLKPYDWIISFIRRSGLPISTLIHIPAGRGLNPCDGDLADYDAVSPNIGRTIFQAQSDIQDLQYIARYLKETLGFQEVGLFTYSLGSLRGLIASMMQPKLFDFGIFQMVADDFTEAVMTGVGTIPVARQIQGKIDLPALKKIWSTISPGAYMNYFSRLPQYTRLVQCEYDFVFGRDNVRRFTEKLCGERADTEIEIAPVSHTTFGTLPTSAGVMWRNVRFIYAHTAMGQYKRARFF